MTTVHDLISRLERCNPDAEVRFLPADGEPTYLLGHWLVIFEGDEGTLIAEYEPDDTKEATQ